MSLVLFEKKTAIQKIMTTQRILYESSREGEYTNYFGLPRLPSPFLVWGAAGADRTSYSGLPGGGGEQTSYFRPPGGGGEQISYFGSPGWWGHHTSYLEPPGDGGEHTS